MFLRLLLLLLFAPVAVAAPAAYDCSGLRPYKTMFGLCNAHQRDHRPCNLIANERIKTQCLAIARRSTSPCSAAQSESERKLCTAIVRKSASGCSSSEASDEDEAWCRAMANRSRTYCSRTGGWRRTCERVLRMWDHIDQFQLAQQEAAAAAAAAPRSSSSSAPSSSASARVAASRSATAARTSTTPSARPTSSPSTSRTPAPSPSEPSPASTALHDRFRAIATQAQQLLDAVATVQSIGNRHCKGDSFEIPPEVRDPGVSDLIPHTVEAMNDLRSFRTDLYRHAPDARTLQGSLHSVDKALQGFSQQLHRLHTCGELDQVLSDFGRTYGRAMSTAASL